MGVSRRVVYQDGQIADRQRLAAGVEAVDLRLRFDVDPEHQSLLHHAVVQGKVGGVEPHGHVEGAPGRRHAGDVIEVRVRQQDLAHVELRPARIRNEFVDFVARIDQCGLTCARTAREISVLHERRYGAAEANHGREWRIAAFDQSSDVAIAKI